jgi:hypothetical protein
MSNRLQIVNDRSAAQAGIDLLPLLGAAALGMWNTPLTDQHPVRQWSDVLYR